MTRIEKKNATAIFRRMVASGKITKPTSCDRCGETPPKHLLCGHHNDYSKPLEVVWLCWNCHAIVEKEMGNRVQFSSGEGNPKSVLTQNDVDEMRRMYLSGRKIISLSKLFDLSYTQTKDILYGKYWKDKFYDPTSRIRKRRSYLTTANMGG